MKSFFSHLLHSRYRFGCLIFALIFCCAELTRLGLWLWVASDISAPTLLGALLRGMVFDGVVASLFALPWWVLAALLPTRFLNHRFAHLARISGFALLVFIALFTLISEFVFWEEFHSRFNFIAVDYLIYTQEVIGNIRQSYPVGTWLLLLTLTSCLAVLPVVRLLTRPIRPLAPSQHWLIALGLIVLPIASTSLLSSDFSEFSNQATANELASNGIWNFFSAYRHNSLSYKSFYAMRPEAKVRSELQALGLDADRLGNNATTTAKITARHPNLVLISVESLSADFMASFGNKDGITPNLDRLAQKSLFFTNHYAVGTRTVRGMEALSTGLPPTPGQAIVRRPNNDNLHTLGGVLAATGYESLFLYGGYGSFDNLNNYFSANHYRVVDRTDIPASRITHENIWGVDDEALFDQTLEEINRITAKHKPFFTHVMTTSNHRPYTYPNGRIDIPSKTGRNGAVKYTDYAINRFLEMAAKQPWFDNTIFVIVADHCASSSGKVKLPIPSYHIPLIIYAPKLVPAQKNDRLMSQMDIPPTLVHLLGIANDGRWFGHDVFTSPPAQDRIFVATFQNVGYMRDSKMIVLSPGKKVEEFSVDYKNSDVMTPIPLDPALADEAIAQYQYAAELYESGHYKMTAQ